MTIPFQFASGQPQVVTGTGTPDPNAAFLSALMGAAKLGADIANQREQLKLDQQREKREAGAQKSAQDAAAAEGEALRQILPMIMGGAVPLGGAGGPAPDATGAVPMGQGAGTSPAIPLGGGTPAMQGGPVLNPDGTVPGVTPVPPGGPTGPMESFQKVVAGLPAASVANFVKTFGPIAQKAQSEKDEEDAFDEANRLTKGLLTPEQETQFSVARMLWKSGAPKEMWESMLPSKQIDLAKANLEIRNTKNRQEADRVATQHLLKLGLVPPSSASPGTEYVVEGAAQKYFDYMKDVKKEARAAATEKAKADREQTIKGLEGAALEVAVLNPDWSSAKIKAALKTNPQYATLSDGVLAKAALEAPEARRRLNAPRNDGEARARITYGPGRAALLTMNALDAKNEALGAAARFAQVEGKEAALAAGGLGTALGAPIGGVGAIPGALIGAGVGIVGAPLIRGAARASMTDDQQRLFNAAQNLAAVIYRGESGGAATPEEVRQTIERYVPLTTDKPQTRELKAEMRRQLDETMANISGLPNELRQTAIESLLSIHEQRLISIGAFKDVKDTSVKGVGGGRSF